MVLEKFGNAVLGLESETSLLSLNDSFPRNNGKFLSLREACDSRYRVILLFKSMSSVGGRIAFSSPYSNYAVDIVIRFIGAGALSFKLDVTFAI